MTSLAGNDYRVIRKRLVDEMLDCNSSNIFSVALEKEGIYCLLDLLCLSNRDIENLVFTKDNNSELERYCKKQVLTLVIWLYEKRVSSLEYKTLEFGMHYLLMNSMHLELQKIQTMLLLLYLVIN